MYFSENEISDEFCFACFVVGDGHTAVYCFCEMTHLILWCDMHYTRA